jgi:hypothetical protein
MDFMPTDGAATHSDWKELYRLAVLETDPVKLPRRISNARDAILNRIQENLTKHRDCHEHQQLTDAVNGLHVLQQDYLRPS